MLDGIWQQKGFQVGRFQKREQKERKEMIVFSGEVTQVKFQEDGFSIVYVLPSGEISPPPDETVFFQGEMVTASGSAPPLQEGMRVNVQGVWSKHARWGWQIKAEFITPDVPIENVVAIVFMQERVDGLGAWRAKQILDFCGNNLAAILNSEKNSGIAQLQAAPGIGKVTATNIVEAWKALTPMDLVDLDLAGMGITKAAREKLIIRFGAEAANVIRKNPWQAVKCEGIGFATADAMARKAGIDLECPERDDAVVIEALHEAAKNSGSTCLEVTEVEAEANRLDVRGLRFNEAVDRCIAEALVVKNGNRLALFALDFMERFIASKLRKMSELSSITSFISNPSIPDMGELKLTQEQEKAVLGFLKRGFGVLTGGPGTGKTTIMKAICRAVVAFYDLEDAVYTWRVELAGAVEILQSKTEGEALQLFFQMHPDARESLLMEAPSITMEQENGDKAILCCAPTGRAAERLAAASGEEAKTIHRLLGFRHNMWEKNADNPLPDGLVVCDEASMVDTALMYRLLAAIVPGRTAFLVVGDADQLPSVGPGAVLRDMLAADVVPSWRLTKIMRQAAENPVIDQCHKVNTGMLPVTSRKEAGTVIVHSKWKNGTAVESDEDVAKAVIQYTGWLKERGYTDRDVQVLSFGKRAACGTKSLNKALREFWLPDAPEKQKLAVGTLVIQTKNNYELGIMNGTQGKVKSVLEDSNGIVTSATIDWDNRGEVFHAGETMASVEPAWAITTHKAQGSEWPWVIIACHLSMGYPLMRTEMLYTAMSRARKGCILIGPIRDIAMTVKAKKGNGRVTALSDYLGMADGQEAKTEAAEEDDVPW